MQDRRALQHGFVAVMRSGASRASGLSVDTDVHHVFTSETGCTVSFACALQPARSAVYEIGALRVFVEGDIGVHRLVESLETRPQKDVPDADQLLRLAREVGQAAICVFDSQSLQCTIAPGHLGGVPVFYHLDNTGCVATTVSRWAAPQNAQADLAGVVGFLRDAQLTGTRTMTMGVKQLVAGQRLVLHGRDCTAQVERDSNMWWSRPAQIKSRDLRDREEELWQAMTSTVSEGVSSSGNVGILMSGGWDSRTVLGAVADTVRAERAIALCHGDLDSAELAIARNLSAAVGAQFIAREIALSDYHSLGELYASVGTSIFPYWRTASEILAQHGADVSTSGVYGEILGGRLSPKFFLRNGVTRLDEVRSLFALFPAALLEGPLHRPNFTLAHVPLPWVLRAELRSEMEMVKESLNADTNGLLDHIESYDTSGLNAVEVFVSLTRRGGYTNGQARTLRSALPTFDVVSPERTLRLINAIPFHSRHNNSLNRRLLQRHQPALLRERVAASLLPARYPIHMQQSARLVRKVAGNVAAAVARRTNRDVPKTLRTGWVNFGFLHRSGLLSQIVESLRSDIWDRDAMRTVVTRSDAQAVPGNLHSLADMLLKVYDVDQWISRAE